MNLRHAPVLLALCFATAAAAGPAPQAAEVAAAERSFAAMAEAEGLGPAFATWSADDAVIFTPEPSSAKATYADPHHHFGDARLAWWPVYAGIARSLDLGFSTGPFDYDHGKGHGWFFTIWRREAGGPWRWVLDHGVPTAEAPAYAPDAPLVSAPGGRPAPRPAAAWGEVGAAEAKYEAALAADARKAVPAFLWRDGRIMRIGAQPAIGRTAFAAAALAGPATIATSRIGGGVSKAGDLAWTYGRAGWEEGGKPREGHYVRVWQRRSGGWKLLVDELTPLPPRRGPAPSATGDSHE